VNLIVIYNFTLFVFGFIYEGADVRLCSLLPVIPKRAPPPAPLLHHQHCLLHHLMTIRPRQHIGPHLDRLRPLCVIPQGHAGHAKDAGLPLHPLLNRSEPAGTLSLYFHHPFTAFGQGSIAKHIQTAQYSILGHLLALFNVSSL
jgi:hypothetical protein